MIAHLVIVDEHEMFRTGLCRLLSQQSWLSIVADVGTPQQITATLDRDLADIIIYDPYHKKGRNFEVITGIKAASPRTKIVILTESDDADDMLQAAKYGVFGYFTKDTPFGQFEVSLHDIFLGNVRISEGLGGVLFKRLTRPSTTRELTQREQDIFRLLEKGLSNKQIALKLNISLYTVKNHVSSVIRKCNLTTRYQLLTGDNTQE